MKISGIDFPEELLNSLRDGKLVVFAGAGVSMGEPANLPAFRRLADAVAQGSGETRLDHEQDDRFLGRLQHKGVDVHSRAAELLLADDPKPNDLHCNLLRLFSTEQDVRIVTTNFDTLFEKAADDVFDPTPEIFKAPALPLGSNLSGIVHVHGSLVRPNEMVLTDSDFGRGYLTEGWARRFLVDLFRSFTVLFVGYSHDDTVMTYLARALPQGGEHPRFVLTDNADLGHWRLLGIEPVIYDKPSCNDHSVLYEGVRGLSTYVSRGILEWRREITEIAKNPPSLNEEEMGLIEDALSDPTRTRFFVNAASHTAWIDWLDRNKHLDSLFTSGLENLSERDELLARWLATQFTRDRSDELFHLMARRGIQVHPGFRIQLGYAIGSPQDRTLEADKLARWVSLLIATAPLLRDDPVLRWLGECCLESGLTNSVIDVFDAMTRSRLELRGGLSEHTRDRNSTIIAELTDTCNFHDVNEIWEKGLKPNLGQIAEPLLARVTSRLEGRHRTLNAWGSSSSEWFHRSAIEPHEQDGRPRLPQPVEVLINVARDCLEHLANLCPTAAANWCDRLVRTETPLLGRLAVHTLTVRTDLTAGEKIEWLLTTIGLHNYPTHHETFRAMRAIYPHASLRHRKTVIDAVFAVAWPEREREDYEQRAAYVRFNWLHWLQESDPKCGLVKQSIKDLLTQYPDFQPRDQPDLTHVIGAWRFVEPQSPWSVDELLSRPADEWSDDLLTLHQTDLLGPDQDGLSGAVEAAATQDFEWGLKLADALVGTGKWDAGIWPALMRAWSRELDETKHRQVFDRLDKTELYANHARSVADALYALVKDGGVTYAAGLLEGANQLAIDLWGSIDEDEPLSGVDDWLLQAINHPAGVVTQYWVASLALWRKQQDPRPRSLGDEYSAAFSGIVEDKTLNGRLGKAVLASQLGFILAADENWATENLIPLFDFASEDDRRAVWDGFTYCNLNPQVADALEDSFLRAVSTMGTLFPDQDGTRKRFVELYTLMVTYAVDDPINTWIPRFLKNGDIDDKCQFAWQIGHILKSMEDKRQQEWWGRWLKRYWENRLLGVPVLLDNLEIQAMLGWLPSFKSVFPQAVNLVIRMSPTQLTHNSVVYDISQGEGELQSKYPEATAKLLVHLADFESPQGAWHFGKKLTEGLLQFDLPHDLKKKLKELFARRGWGTGDA